MKKFFLTLMMLGLGVLQLGAQVAMIELNDIPGNTQVCVTNYGPYIASVNSAAQAGITSVWVIATNAVTKQTKLTLNGQPWQMSTSGVFAVATVAQGAKADTALQPAATNGLASVESLYTLMATNRVTRWYQSETNWLEYSGGNAITEYWIAGASETSITFSADFADTGTSQTLYPLTLPWPFEQSGWVGHDIDYLGIVSHYIVSPGSGAEWICPIGESTLSPVSGNSAGTATITVSPVVTAVTYRLQTNDVPPETWSYADMTNWLAEGGAGETWATDLAADAATTVLNNHIAPILASPYSPWTTNLWAELGTATVTYACGNQPSLVCTNATVITLDSTGYGTSGVSRVGLSLYCGTNTVTFLTNAVDYATTPTLVTNAWNTILFRRVSADRWKGAQLQ